MQGASTRANGHVDDVFAAIGLAVITAGIAMLSVPVALIITGGLILGFGVLLGLGSTRPDDRG